MKATLEYVFNLPDESEKLEDIVNGPRYKNVLWELDQWLRGQIKHCDKNELQPARDKIFELLEEHNLTFY